MDHTTRTLILSRTAVIAALAIAFALVLSTALLSAFAARDLARTDELGTSAKRAVTAATQLLATVALAESVIEESEARAARAQLRSEVLALAGQFTDRPDLRPYLRQLEWLSRDLDGIVAPLTAAPVEAAQGATLLTRFAEMRRWLYALQRQEFAALVEYSAAAATRARSIQSLNGGLSGVALALALTGAWLLFRRMREIEGLITVCAWTRRVQWQGRWISFEEYLARRFNLRCTHGICDEAAQQMRDEMSKTQVQTQLPLTQDNQEEFLFPRRPIH